MLKAYLMPQQQPQNQKDPSLYKLPPHSIEAEESILSAILIDNNTLLDVFDILTSEDFYKTAHKIIFSAIADLFAKTEPVDLVTLSNILKEQGRLEKIGGATYLARLVDAVPLAVNAQHYARIVHDKASLRRLIEKANIITSRCFEDRGNVDEVIDFAESSIFEISQNKTNQAFYPMSSLIEFNINTLEERQGNKALVTGVPTGFFLLDQMTSGFQKSDLIIIAGRPSIVSYVNVPKIVRQVYAFPLVAWTMGANALHREGVFLRPHWLPSLSAVDKYLRPCISGIGADEKGVTMESYGSGILGDPVMGAALSASVLMPSLVGARTHTRQAISGANLHMIYLAITIFICAMNVYKTNVKYQCRKQTNFLSRKWTFNCFCCAIFICISP